MTGPRKITPKQPITFGGVKLNANEIASKKIIKENGATRFVIDFKNGSTVKYPEQASKNNSSIYFNENASYRGTIYIDKIYGAEFKGSDGNVNPGFDYVHAKGCKNCIFDISNDNTPDRVILENSGKFKSQNNKIKLDKEDTANIDYKDWLQIEGEGTHVEGNE